MHVLLEVVSGPHVGQRFNPQEGLVWRFGQTEWADFSFPNDTLMEEFAFRLDCRDQRCLLQALGSTPTLVNGQPADELVLSPGDRLFAGETELLVTIDGLSAAPESGDDAGQSDEGDGAAAAGLAFASAAELAKHLELENEAPGIAATASDADDLVLKLGESGDYVQAFRVRAYTLGQVPAVIWGCRVVENVYGGELDAVQTRAHQAAMRWAGDPSEATCRDAERAAEHAEHEGPSAMLALAAFWCGDNIAPAESPSAVPPHETLFTRAVAASLIQALYASPDPPPERQFANFLQWSAEVESGERPVQGTTDH